MSYNCCSGGCTGYSGGSSCSYDSSGVAPGADYSSVAPGAEYIGATASSGYSGLDSILENYSGNSGATGTAQMYDFEARTENNPADTRTGLQIQTTDDKQKNNYSKFNYNPLKYFTKTQAQYFMPENFLNIYRPNAQFIDDAEQIRDLVKETFKIVTGEDLPEHFIITVCDENKCRVLHESNSGRWSKGIQGFSINLSKQIVVKNNKLDNLMLVIGHELGHILSPPLKNILDEEAKAFAFEVAWMKAIVEHNIGGLKDSINTNFSPANNGLHDIAYYFVKRLVDSGRKAMDIFRELIDGSFNVCNYVPAEQID